MQNLALIIIVNLVFFSGVVFFQDGGQFFEDATHFFVVNESVNATVGATKTAQLKTRPVQKKKKPSLLSRFLKKQTPAEKFSVLEKELLEVKAKGTFISPDHANRIWADLSTLEKQGYLKNELDRLRALTVSLIVQSNKNNGQVPQGRTNTFAALEGELREVKARGMSLSPEHAQLILSNISALERQGYAPSEIERLRKMVFDVSSDLQDQERQRREEEAARMAAPKKCPDTPPVLTADITDFSNIQKVTAPGTPVPSDDRDRYKGHGFIWTNHQRVPVYVPTDAILNSVSYVADNVASPAQYRLGFEVKSNCNYSFRFDHIDEVIPRVKAVAPATPSVGRQNSATPVAAPSEPIAIEFKAGDLVGYTQGTRQAGNWDFGLYDLSKEGPLGALGAFGLGAHAVCWVDYFSPEKQAAYRGLLDGPRHVCSF